MPTYSYLPLRYNDSIRLIELSPGTSEDPCVHCNITRRRLSDPMLRYEAISYTWGDPLDRETLSCGGYNAELPVTRNCYDALRSLRRSDKARTIWIDAICINQHNILERNAQVRIMDRIYGASFRVVAYLGKETQGSRSLFDELAMADSLYQSTQSFEGRPLPNAELVHELDDLFHRPWFSRIWVLQEVYVAKEVMIMCGTSHGSMLALYNCTLGYRRTRVTRSLLPVPVFMAVYGSSKFPITGDPAASTWKLLADTRNCGATDPRDKIFALKALSADNQRELDKFVDYSRSVETVFNDITMFLLPRVKLWLLLAVLHPHTLKMPSWQPDWSGNSTPNVYWHLGDVPRANSKEEFKICHLKCSHEECNGQHSILRVQGIQHSRISHLGASFDFEGAEELCLEAVRHVRELTIPHQSLGTRHACGNSCRNILSPLILEALQHLNDRDRADLLSRGYVGIGRDYSTWIEQPLSIDDITVIAMSLQNCRIFLSDDGTIGLAPNETCEGDIICILRGSMSPSILRQRLENGWTLVSGDCHVLGELQPTDDEDYLSDYVDAHGDKEEEFLIW